MADFGWAYVKGNLVTGSAPPSGAVQYNDGNNNLAASGDLIFISGATSQLNLTGNLDVVGDLSASFYYGDGSNLINVGGVPGGSDQQIQFNSGSSFSGSSNFTYDYVTNTLTLSGTLNISGTLATNELVVNVENRNVINISATGSTQFGDSTDDTHIFTGSMEISTSANPLKLYGLQAGTPPNSSSYLALDSNYNLVLTSAAGTSDGGTIGEAEDGTYTDGLFSDFLSSTPIGTAIDKFNEILKIIVPGPAPSVDRINYTNPDGLGLKIGEPNGGYVAIGNTGSFNDSLGINSQFSSSTSGEDFRLGTYNGSQQITGTINFQVLEQFKSTELNYSNNAFGNAESGSLNLYINGALAHSLDLNGFAGSGQPNSGSAFDFAPGSNTGFFEISTTASATDQNGSEYDIFKHRTAKFIIDTVEQYSGWNYAKVEHSYGSTTYITNFIQWYNDTDASSQSMTAQNQAVIFTGHGPNKFLSGVEYYRSGTLQYSAEATNFYKFTYPTGSLISFNTSANLFSVSNQTPNPANGSSNQLVTMTASVNTKSDVMLNDAATISFNLTHPLKTDLSSTGSVTTNEILIYNVNTASSNLVEYFDDETYRLVNASWTSQAEVSSPTDVWSSQNHMTSSGATGHTDGLLFYNGKLVSPKQGANTGNFSSLVNAPSLNPDYSSTTGTRTFFRKIQNTSGVTKYDLKISSTKNTKINNSTLSTDNIKFYIKLPGTSGWMDISQNFSFGNIADGDGALVNGATANTNTSTTATGNSVHCVTFGTASIANNDYVVIKIEADASWTKYIDSLTFQLGASAFTATQAPSLDNIDLNNSNGESAILSFGSSNTIPDYFNVTGVGSISAVDFNESYIDNSTTNRGVFKSYEIMTGNLNEDVVVSGQNYSNDSFYNAYSGSLVLEVNGVESSTLNLTSSLSTINNISTNTGFSVSAVSYSKTSDLIPDYTKPYRTGTYSIDTSLQRVGWNYARVIHRTATDLTTNYVEWVVDPSGSVDDTSVSSTSLTNFNGDLVYYQSGIGYFYSTTSNTLPSASFQFRGDNFYRNVYSPSSDAVSVTTDNCDSYNLEVNGTGLNSYSTPETTMLMPSLNGGINCELTEIQVTSSIRYGGTTSISGGLGLFSTPQSCSINGTLKHVNGFKSNKTTSTLTKNNFLFYSGSLGSSNQNTAEYFGLETYRIVSGNYSTQSDATGSSNTWSSSTAMNNGGTHDDGMVTVNGFLISPKQVGAGGDTRNIADEGVFQAPINNPDYSSLSESTRTYYRYFKNNTVNDQSNITITLYGSGSMVEKSTSLGSNGNFHLEVKIPGDTAWLDAGKSFTSNNKLVDGSGALVGGSSPTTISTGGTSFTVTYNGGSQLGTSGGSQAVVLKFSANQNWIGYLSRISVTYNS